MQRCVMYHAGEVFVTTQAEPGLLATFVKLFPDLVREAAASPLGVVALIVLVLSLVIMVLFRRGTWVTLVAFLAFLLSLTALGYRVMEVYPEVLRENREMVVGPQAYELTQDTSWTAPNIRIRSGTVIDTNGHAFSMEATKGELIVEGAATIRSFKPGASPQPPPDKPPPRPADDLTEAEQCKDGGAGNRGPAGETGAPGAPGKNAGVIKISAPRASGTLDIINRGADGGPGGRGGNGGTGGKGQRGGRGRQNYMDLPFNAGRVPTDCGCGGAYGGPGGRGGDAGAGGPGGPGGAGGSVIIAVADASDFKVSADVRGGCSGLQGPPGAPGEPGGGGDGGRGDGHACRDETNSRRGPNGTERGSVPQPTTSTRVRGGSGSATAEPPTIPVTLAEGLECS